MGKTATGTINSVNIPINTETVIGSITLDPGVWLVAISIWNPTGSNSISIAIKNTNISVLAVSQQPRLTGWLKPTQKTTYNIVCSQWAEANPKLNSGSVGAIRLK